ncbi:MAG: VWA domain-containing protein [Ruminiclostridium sp.]|nr:VWA domain-containing protein [Ruminiclostridium sp.]
MERNVLSRAAEYINQQRKKKRWTNVVSVLAAVVVFCTTYALILPAITLETDVFCGREEHTHGADCYGQVLTCTLPEGEAHVHTDACYQTERTLVCTLKESQGHTHTADCQRTETLLTCTSTEEGHVHGEGCYTTTTTYVCGLEESSGHTHTDACWQETRILVCTQNTEGPQGGHVHSEACYGPSREPTCGLEEHRHDDACYADREADRETAAQWEKTFDQVELSGEFPADVLAIAETQLGYTESSRNYIINDQGRKLGYSRYGAWYGAPYGDWCAMFVSFCLHYAGVPAEAFPREASCQRWIEDLTDLDLYREAESYIPTPGDLIFFNWDKEPDADHVGLVEEVVLDEKGNCKEIKTIEGNSSNKVQRVTYVWGDPSIMGYGDLPEQKYLCGLEVHAHSADCYDTEETLICGLYAHDHEKDCLTGDFVLTSSEEELQEEPEEEPSAEEEPAFTGDPNTMAEAAIGTNWMRLRDSGWFEEYSSYAGGGAAQQSRQVMRAAAPQMLMTADAGETASAPPSDVQVNDRGGRSTSSDGAVTVSKTISGTDLENVFDITLQVQTAVDVKEIREEPDMAVVIVMDISQTMNSDFGNTTRYAAAMDAAEDFLDKFAESNSLGISKVGYVAFNTDAHKILELQSCATPEQAAALKNTMRTKTGAIINASGYADSHKRFTNVEAGLKMGADMLSSVTNENKYIIFLSDGFPTTYVSSSYIGYDPYTDSGTPGTDGVFYDSVFGVHCDYGTSYSDKAAIRARQQAAVIKASGATIFSIGVDVAGQTIQYYIDASEGKSFSIVDRTGTTYEIGNSRSTEAYKNWLRNSIGSGYYYDSTDSAGLSAAYDTIFEEIKSQVEAGSVADWVATDPLPTLNNAAETVEFIGFYTKDSALTGNSLSGMYAVDGEDTASFDGTDHTISWDLKNSGYQTSTSGTTTLYTFELVYRVRLQNENNGFVEGTIYPTNDPTSLQYRTTQTVDGQMTISDPKTVNFLIPSVHGYLAELSFKKVDSRGQPLPDAEFTLSHDPACNVCRGDETSVSIDNMVKTSESDGTVFFGRIPSGHVYKLVETRVPDGYSSNGYSYRVEVAYDEVTVTVTATDGTEKDWNGTIVNNVYYVLPETGGAGTNGYTFGGLLLMLGAGILLYRKTRDGREAKTSS